MPNWNQLLDEARETGSPFDVIRRKYLKKLRQVTGRNVIIYYSAWLQKKNTHDGIIDADKTGFMSAIHGMDVDLGLDLVLHTPGGDLMATESLVDYLRSIFGRNIRAMVPQLAMSAGTMIALSCKSVVMGKQSSLGPTDPQYGGFSAHAIIDEVKMAYDEIKEDPAKMAIWQPILAKYKPTLIGECKQSIDLADSLLDGWLRTGMFFGDDEKERDEKVARIVGELGVHDKTKSHARHISLDRCEALGIKVERLEKTPKLQDALLSVHHACIHTMSGTQATKIIENHRGTAYISKSN